MTDSNRYLDWCDEAEKDFCGAKMLLEYNNNRFFQTIKMQKNV